MEPETRYARLGEDHVAFQTVGEGPVDLVISRGSFSTLDATWSTPETSAPYLRLASICRLILFDRLRWVSQLQLHDDMSREHIARHGGRLVKSTGDGFLALFDGPGRGLHAAGDMAMSLDRVGLPVRAGLHAGEIEVRGQDVAGVGVHIAARVMARARPAEVMVSRTVRDLVVGSDFRFVDRGSHHLKGVEGEWQLFALVGP